MGYSPWGHKELDTTERLTHTHTWLPSGSEVKNLPAMQETQETQSQSLGQEGPLREGMAIYSSILAQRILWTEEPGGIQPTRTQTVGHN